MENEKKIEKALGIPKELISLIQTEDVGYVVSISRSVKVGRTATEMTSIRMEGHAKDGAAAKEVLADLDKATMAFIEKEAGAYGIVLKEAPNKPSPAENKA